MIDWTPDQHHDDDALRPRMMDWLARWIAVGTMKVSRIAASRWFQRRNAAHADDLERQAFEVVTSDGETLEGFYFLPSGADSTLVKKTPIVFSHGITESKECHHRLARLLTSQGHCVIMYDHRGHGRSKAACTFGVSESNDLRCVIDHAVDEGWIKDDVITMGVSLGGATVIMHGATDVRVKGVVAYAPFADFTEAIRSYAKRYVKWLSSEWGVRGFVQASVRRGFDIRDAVPVDLAPAIHVPVLIIVGDHDCCLPADEHARVIADAMLPEGDVKLVIVPGANHFNICVKRWEVGDEEMLAFCERIEDACLEKP